MRIIENPNPSKETEVRCEKCKCLFAYRDGDVKKARPFSDFFLVSWVENTWVECPNCGEHYVIN